MSVRSAGVVLFRRGRGGAEFLLLKYPGGHWDFVKGKMERGETSRETALRETEEETGITDVRFVDGFEERIGYEFEHRGRTVRKSVVFFLAETRAKRVKLSHEHLEYAWRGYGGAMGAATFGNARRVLERAHLTMQSQEGGAPRAPG